MDAYTPEHPKHADNPRYSLDEAGQWWYRPFSTPGKRVWPRLRAYVKECSYCATLFLWQVRTRHWSTKTNLGGFYCSIQCANRAIKPELRNTVRGPASKNWRGGRRTTQSGYVEIWTADHPKRNRNNYIPEHRLVMEGVIGRYLESYEEVHHKNGDRGDNRPENLELWLSRQPPGQRAKDLVAHARWILERYEPLELQGKLI